MKPRNQCSQHLNVLFAGIHSPSPLREAFGVRRIPALLLFPSCNSIWSSNALDDQFKSAGIRRTPNASRDRASRLCRAFSTLLLALAVSAGQGRAASTNIDAKMAVSARQARAASANNDVNKEKERKLIDILKSDVPPADKAVPCKQLVVYGTKD